jgi:hypothetical protein
VKTTSYVFKQFGPNRWKQYKPSSQSKRSRRLVQVLPIRRTVGPAANRLRRLELLAGLKMSQLHVPIGLSRANSFHLRTTKQSADIH